MILFQPILSTHFDLVTGVLKTHNESQDFKRFGLAWSDSQIQVALSKDICLGLFDSDALVAMIVGRQVDPLVFEIDLTMTHKNHLKKGLMEKLFIETVGFLKEKGIQQIWLEVHEENTPAIQFYRKVGFQENAKRPKYYPDGKSAILMTRVL